MDRKRPRKLNLNAPLLSTRRFGNPIVADTSCSSYSVGTVQNTSERVPFSWEKAPGKPKETEGSDNNTQDGDTPRLRRPPRHWTPPKEAAEDIVGRVDDDAFHDHGDGSCYAIDEKDDFFSDAMDVFSLSEALDYVQKKSENAHTHSNTDNNDGLKLKLAESNGYQSPTYMINRFLPDATALAASSSALHFSTNIEEKVCDTCSYPECYTRHSYASSPKGCGLELLFPWRMKHKLCSIKSPVLPCSSNLHKPQHNSKQKKHRSSTTYIPCTSVKDI